jgi:hypothetical protein
MFKFLKKTSKKLAWTAFGVWKDKKIQRAKETVATKLDGVVDGTTKGIQFGVFGIIVLAGCAGGAFVLLPIAYCMGQMASALEGSDNTLLTQVLANGANALCIVGGIMAAIVTLVIVITVIICQIKKKRLKSQINEAFRD